MRLVAVVAVLIGLTGVAHAQDLAQRGGGGILTLPSLATPPTGGGFTGIGDLASIPTPVVYLSAGHCLKSSYAGNMADITVGGVVKGTLTCSAGGVIGLTAVGGSGWTLATAQSTCTTSTSGCSASTLYDQVGTSCSGGACNATPVTAGGVEIIFANGTSNCGSTGSFANSGTWCLQTNAGPGSSSPQYNIPAITSVTQPWSQLIVYDNLNTSAAGDFLRSATNTYGLLIDNGATVNLTGYAGSVATVTASVTDLHMLGGIAQFNAAVSSSISVNGGTPVTTTLGSGAISSEAFVLFGVNAGSSFFGYFYEASIFKGTSLVPIISSIISNWASFWGGGI